MNPPVTGEGQDVPRSATREQSGWGMEILMKIGAGLFFFLSGFAIYAGWKLRHREYLTAETGTGYLLGIVGSVMMLVLLLYPLRKRFRFMANWGPISYWFRIHMMLGVVGPICILYHANFTLGSTNSSVALFSMLLVAGSGLIGRYLYVKIHYGLYGRRMNLKELIQELEEEKGGLARSIGYSPDVRQQLLRFSSSVLNHSKGFFPTLGIFFFIATAYTLDLSTFARPSQAELEAGSPQEKVELKNLSSTTAECPTGDLALSQTGTKGSEI